MSRAVKSFFAGLMSTCACISAASEQPAPAAQPEGSLYLVRLTPAQYERSIRDIFGSSIQIDVNKAAPGFRDEGLLALGTRRLTITSAEMQQYEKLAQDVATQVVQPNRRATLLGCKPVSEKVADEKCAGAFLQKVGLHLFRRPLTADELQPFVATHSQAAQQLGSFDAGVRAALARMLVAPEFLFRVEFSEPDPSRTGTQRLDAWSTASRLSFFLWDSVPDAELFAAAQSGEILTAAGIKRQVERMLISPRVEGGLRAFFSDMLGFDGFATLSVDSTLYPRFTKNVLEDADEQTLRTIVDQLLVRNNSYGDLFTTRETFLTPSLAALYGVPLPRSQELGGAVPWVPYKFADSDPRIGILSQASFLSLNSHPGTSSPTLRGKAVREKLLCQKVPPPPGNVDFSLVQDLNNPAFKTARQRLTAHSTEAMCAGCHKITDPMGLALEQFDTASGFRTKERGEPIDATGSLNGKNFDGIVQMAQVLREQPGTTSCVINRAYSYGTQRKPTADERKWLANLQKELGNDGVRWRELMRRVTLGPDFFAVPAAAAAQVTTAQAAQAE
jgi:Protein of unknown function (DUF1592)/Protein of unknown function (DUF1588)/Protein of unknown function (DUF1595)/Protein of unknown function (DUF1585)/Protein of unknown function (DUF1587)